MKTKLTKTGSKTLCEQRAAPELCGSTRSVSGGSVCERRELRNPSRGTSGKWLVFINVECMFVHVFERQLQSNYLSLSLSLSLSAAQTQPPYLLCKQC